MRERRYLLAVNLASLAVVRAHSDSVLALRIVFNLGLVLVLLSGVYIFRIRKAFRSRPGSGGASIT